MLLDDERRKELRRESRTCLEWEKRGESTIDEGWPSAGGNDDVGGENVEGWIVRRNAME
jgi:hypothetical protein